MRDGELECLGLAARQLGVVSRDQALRWLSPQQVARRVASRAWESFLPRVYRIEGTPRTWLQKLKALSLWAGRGYAFSHETAAGLHCFDRFVEGPLVVSVTRHLSPPQWAWGEVELHRVSSLGSADLETVQGLRTTSATRTLIDLAAVATDDDLRAAVDQALQRKWTSVERLALALEPRRGACGKRGVTSLRGLVRRYQGGDGPSESELEARIFELLLASGLPMPVRQRVIRVAGGVRRIDFLFEDFGVVLEADGYAYHSSAIAFEKDRQRYNSLTARDFKVLQWTWEAIHERADQLMRELAVVLASRFIENRGDGDTRFSAVT